MKYRIIPVTSYQQNCSLVWCNETLEAAFIDPGGDIDKLVAAIREENVKLTKIFLTHGHMDHVGATAELVQRFGIPVEGPHHDDRFWLEALDQQAMMMGFSRVDLFEPNRWLSDGEVITVGKVTLEVHHCPGHTPGHVIFFHKNTNRAFVGDVLFNGSIGRTDFPRGNHQQLLSSIKEKLWPLGDDVEFVPGHGPMSTFGEERKTNPFVADNQYG